MTKKVGKCKIVIGDYMKSKEKERVVFKVTIKRIIIFFASIIILLDLVLIYNRYFNKNTVLAKEENESKKENVKISNATNINLDEIIEKNVGLERKEEYYFEEMELEYITKYRTNSSLPKGVLEVKQEGREGKQQITKKRVYENGEVVSEEQVGSKIIKAAVDKIVEVGSSKYKSNYKVKVGDTVRVSSDRASIMVEPSEDSQKIATLAEGKEIKILEINDNWYRISGEGTTGYIKIENTTYNYKFETEKNNTNNKTTNKNISFEMALNKPSGLTLEDFKKVLNDTKDTNKIFINNAEYFYYIEKQYNINGIFVAAVGIHESNWGTSKIAQNKNNLFGYGAYDSNPYNGAYSFSNYSESIDLIARVFVKYYLNPKGTNIYGGEKAVGTYYNGANLSGINQKYATDKNWANGVYNHMKYLYNKL